MPGTEARKLRDNWLIRHKFILRSILIIIGILLPLMCLEFGSFLIRKFPYEPAPLITKIHAGWIDFRTFDPLLFWKLTPNTKKRNIETNSLGLRCKDISRHKKNEFRILSLGESTTFGLWLKYEQTYSALIEKNLKYVKGKRLSVINAGIPGYTLFQGYTYLKYRGIKFKPDAVMIYFGYNDFLVVAYLMKRDAMLTAKTKGLNDWELFKKRQTFSWKALYWLAERSNFVRGLVSWRQPKVKLEDIHKDPEKVRVPQEHREELLKMFNDFCRERQIHFIIIVPWYMEFTRHISLLKEFAEKNRVTIVDLPEKLKNLPKPKQTYFKGSIHPNEKGHMLIAEAIVEELVRLWQNSSR